TSCDNCLTDDLGLPAPVRVDPLATPIGSSLAIDVTNRRKLTYRKLMKPGLGFPDSDPSSPTKPKGASFSAEGCPQGHRAAPAVLAEGGRTPAPGGGPLSVRLSSC